MSKPTKSRFDRAKDRALWATLVATTEGYAAVAASAYGIVVCNSRYQTPDHARAALMEALRPLVSPGPYQAAEWLPGEAGLPPHLAAARVAFRSAALGDHSALVSLELDTRPRPAFTARVLRCVQAIPAGSVLSYQQVAAAAGSPKASRAVGQVMAHNQLAPIVPCHRVIAAGGRPGGFASGVDRKLELLRVEGVCLENL